MSRIKSSVQNSTSKPFTIGTQLRFQKVQHLNHIISQTVDNSDEKKDNVGDKILETLKTHIKNNYDNLYQNYGDNKKKIFKQIQAVQTNFASQTAMNSRFDELVKDKSKYDRLHAQVTEKQVKLKKLRDIQSKLTEETKQKIEFESQNIQKNCSIDEQRESLQHQGHILSQMLSVRQKIKIFLHQKYLRLKEELEQMKQRYGRLAKENQKKMQFLATKFEEEQIQIPQKLAEQLSLKLEMYENKHSYNSIIEHQALLQQKRFAKLKESIKSEREQLKLYKAKRQIEWSNRLQQLQNITIIKNLEQQKIKKFCCLPQISSQQDINKGAINAQSLQKLAGQIEQKIIYYESQNLRIQSQTLALISNQSLSSNNIHLDQAEKKLQKTQKQCDLLKKSLQRWQNITQNWKMIISLLPQNLQNEDFESNQIIYQDQKRSQSSNPKIPQYILK